MAQYPIFDPADFCLDPNFVYACAGGETPFLHAHQKAFHNYVSDKGRGYRGRENMAAVQHARELVAEDWAVPVDEIGFTAKVAEGMSILAESLDLGCGDNIILEEQEYL